MRRLLVAALMANFLQFVLAKSADPIDCRKAITTNDLTFCQAQELNKAQEALNKVYANSLKAAGSMDQFEKRPGVPANVKKTLEKAQQRWAQYQEANCANVLAIYSNGREARLYYLGCKIDGINARIKVLNDFYFSH